MANNNEIKVPDIGTSSKVSVIEILVKKGQTIRVDDSLITLESDKASMDVPASKAGTIKEITVKVGDKVGEGDVIILLEATDTAQADKTPVAKPEAAAANLPASSLQTIYVPDLGTSNAVAVIEVAVNPDDEVAQDATLITLESDKASMDVPAIVAGKIKKVLVKVGDKVKTGDAIVEMETQAASASKTTASTAPVAAAKTPERTPSALHAEQDLTETDGLYAGPAVRRLARELDINLQKLKGTGRKGRIQIEDVYAYVKPMVQSAQSGQSFGAGLSLPPLPDIDHSKYGEIEVKELSKIQKISGPNLQRNWIMVPHVTQFDEADITDLEEFRKQQNQEHKDKNIKITPLVFIMKAAVAALKMYPFFNASLDKSGNSLILKKYYHIGVAVDTPNGLVVAVIRDVDKKSILELSTELSQVSEKARTKGLSLNEMQGSSFTISSLGGIGGTAFTPIVNLPDVAILGVSRSSIKPVYINEQFVPRLMLPLSLSYDHRVIDGANGARFTRALAEALSDIRKALL